MNSRKVLGVTTLALINVAAIVSLRNLSIMVEFGLGSLFYFVMASMLFFIPSALVCAELATTWPQSGGVYRWVSEAFGRPMGFMAIWIAWMLSISWFPAVLTFSAASLAYMVDPSLSESPTYMVVTMLSIFWGSTFVNFRGLKLSSLISSVGVIIGTIVPGVLIIGFGLWWFTSGQPLQFELSWEAAIPPLNLQQMVLFGGILFGLAGMEMSAFHAGETKSPQRDYPRAILLSAVIILSLSLLGALSIAAVVSAKDVSLFAGLLQAFVAFLAAFGLSNWLPLIAAFTVIGSLAGINTWILGPAKGILTAAEHGFLPPFMHTINQHNIPVATLVTQAILGSVLTLVFLVMPNVNTAFWIIEALSIIVGMMMYMLIFASVIKLRYSQPEVTRPFSIPGKTIGLFTVAGAGFGVCLFTLVISFLPPEQLETGSHLVYQSYLWGGLALLFIPPAIFLKIKKPHWCVKLPQEAVEDV